MHLITAALLLVAALTLLILLIFLAEDRFKFIDSYIDRHHAVPHSTQRKTDNSKLNARSEHAEEKHWHSEEHHHHKVERFFWVVSAISTLAAAGGAIATVVISNQTLLEARNATKEAQRQAIAAESTLALGYPPKIHLIHFEIPNEPVGFSAAERIRGSAQLFLSGRNRAKIVMFVCMAYWGKGAYLPMLRPYIPLIGHQFPDCSLKIRGKIYQKGDWIEAGSFLEWNFESAPAPSNDASRTLYVMGFVEFADDRTSDRFSLYARRYDTTERRFVKVNNTDYEREDESALDGKTP